MQALTSEHAARWDSLDRPEPVGPVPSYVHDSHGSIIGVGQPSRKMVDLFRSNVT